MSWAEKVKEIEEILVANNKRIRELEILVKPFEEKIEKIKQEGKPYWSEMYKLSDQVKTLEWQLKVAKEEAFIETLQVGTKVWIRHSPYYRGRYEIYTSEQRKTILEKKAGAVFHQIEITARTAGEEGRDTFRAKEGKKRIEFFGSLYRSSGKMPKLTWTKGGGF